MFELDIKWDAIGAVFTVLAFLLSFAGMSFAAYRYVQLRREEHRTIRYNEYHKLLSLISKGQDADGTLKSVSQIALIYELRHFPEYRELTKRLMLQLVSEWGGDANYVLLRDEVASTLKVLDQHTCGC